MLFRYERDGIVWIDLERPTAEEIRQIKTTCSIGERIAEELASPTPLPFVTCNEDSALIVLHFPTRDPRSHELREQEVDFVVGKDYVITVRYEVVTPLHMLRKMLEASEITHKGGRLTADALIELLLNHLFESIRDHAKDAAHRLTKIEHDMFAGKERTTVRTISEVNREFLHLEAAVANQEEALLLFLRELEHRSFFGPTFVERVKRITSERAQIAHLLETNRAIAAELRETNASLLNANQNEIMKTLTVITFIMLPLELVAGVFAMDMSRSMPLVNNPYGFWIIVGFMCALGLGLTLFFTRKRWL